MKSKIFDATDLVAGGIQPALPHSANPLWRDGQNVVFQENSVRPVPAQVGVASKISTEPPRGAFECRLNGVRQVFWGSQTKLFRLVEGDGAATDVSRASGGAYTGSKDSSTSEDAHSWTFAQWGDEIVVASNGKDSMQWWDAGTSKFKDFATASLSATGHPSYAKIVVQLNQHLLALGTDAGDYVVEWCSQDALATWTPAVTNSAGNLVLYGMNSPILAAVPLQDGIGVYGSDDLFLLRWIGSPFYIGQQRLLSGVGALGPNAVVGVGRLHYGICQRGIFRTDGVSPEWIDRPGIYDYLFSQDESSSTRANVAQASKTFAWHDPSQNMVYFFYPAGSSVENSRGVGFNYKNNSWTILSFGRTCGTAGTVFFHPFVFDTTGGIYQQVVGNIMPSVGASPLLLDATVVIEYGVWGDGIWGWRVRRGVEWQRLVA